jgi:hypothetical protein
MFTLDDCPNDVGSLRRYVCYLNFLLHYRHLANGCVSTSYLVHFID